MKGISVNKGTNIVAVILGVYGMVEQMPDGIAKSVLLGMILIAAMLVLLKTKDVISVDDAKSIKDVLKQGRDEDESSGN